MKWRTRSYSKRRSRSWAASNMRRNDGIALIFVLWVMVLLSGIALEMAFRGHLRVQETAATAQTTKAFFLARAGVEKSIADLANEAGTVEEQQLLRDDAESVNVNAALGEGTYTLYAGTDEDGAPVYGMEDESSKLNINVVEATVLDKLPEMESGLAEAIVAIRGQEPFRDLKDLLQIEGIDAITLYGEDQNENGLLDANENDGDQSWPPDNADGWLDGGLSRYLTTWSASLDLSAEGNARVDLTQDDAETITQEIKDVSQQQADSIVARRDSGGFSSVLDLLEVELVEMTQEQPQEGDQRRERQEQPTPQENEKPSQGNTDEKKDEKKDEQRTSSGKGNAKEGRKEEKPGQNAEGEEPKDSEKPKDQPKTVAKGTGQKAFDESTVRKIADLATISKEAVRKGLININTAPYEVLACLPGLDETLAEAIVRERDTRAGGFTTVIDLLDVNGMSVDKLKQCYEMMTARSDVFTVRSYGVIDGGAVCVGVGAVIDRSDDTIHILHWQEYE